jgi:hypothetical protein
MTAMIRITPPEQLVSSNTLIDPATGIEFLTYEECKIRGLKNYIYNKNGIPFHSIVIRRYLYRKQTKIHPMYRKNLSREQRANPDLFAVAPRGFVWKEDPSCTDEYYRLVMTPYI